jgi:hypothetical protein
MSYLRGPLTRNQIAQAMAPAASLSASPATTATPTPTAEPAAVPVAPAAPPSTAPAVAGPDETPVMPSLASAVPVAFVDPAAPWLAVVGGVAGGQHLRAAAVARVDLTYDEGTDVVAHEEYEAVLLPLSQVPDVRAFVAVDYDDRDLVPAAPPGAVFGLVPAEAKSKSYWTALQKALVEELTRSRTVEILVNTELKALARPGERREDFVARCTALADVPADKQMTALRTKYEAKLAAARQKLTDAQINAQSLASEYDANFGLAATGISVLGSLLGGRRSRSSLAADARRQSAASAKVGAAEQKAEALGQTIADLEAQLNEEITALDDEWTRKAQSLTTRSVPLEKSDVVVRDFRLVWIPVA